MNRPSFDEEAAVVTDAYIDLLLDRHSADRTTAVHERPIAADLTATMELLHEGLPRLHPSFTFEEDLAGRLRASTDNRPPAEVIRLRLPTRPRQIGAGVDRRMLLGGAAIAASGVSMAAVYAWRHAARRPRRRGEVTA
jgi:hypothetical protein